MAHRMNI